MSYNCVIIKDNSAIIATQDKRIAELDIIIVNLLAMVQNLQVQLSVRKNSRNSSIRPDQDLEREIQSRREQSDKKSGGRKATRAVRLIFRSAPDVVADLNLNYSLGHTWICFDNADMTTLPSGL